VLPDKLGPRSFPKEDGVDHRVEPPAWLPQGAAPEAADPEADESTATEDAQQAQDSNDAPAETEEFSNGNGHDSSFTYSHDDSYQYGGDSPYGEGTSYRSPFTPHTPGGTSYEPEEPASAENGLATSDVADEMPHAVAPGHDLPASGLSEGALPGDALPGDLSASGLDDPAMPDTSYASAAAGFHSPGSNYTDHGPGYADQGSGSSYADHGSGSSYTDQGSGSSYTDQGSGSSYADHGSGSSYADHGSGSSYTDQGSGSSYADTAAASYSDPAALPYPAAEPLATAGTAASEPTTAAFSGPGTATKEQRATFGSTAAMAGGIGAALRAGKQRSTAKFSRSQQPVKSRPGVSQARKANLVISRVEPWSVMKFSFLISLVLWIVMFVAVALLYYALSSLGVFDALQRTLASVTSSQTSAGVNLTKWTSAPRILGYTMLLGAVDVVLITAISTVGAVIYNLVTHLGGGIEVTLKETE
jgi:hypothetical protein